MKISLTMIVKNGLDDLKRLEPLVRPHIDEWVVVVPPGDKAIKWAEKSVDKLIVQDFTQPIEPEIQERMKKAGLEVQEDARLFNFAAARNKSLEEATGDFVLWLDADDTPIGLENLRKYIEENKCDTYYAVYDYFRDEENNSVSDHVRERVFRNNGKYMWKGAELGLIHETVLPIKGFRPYELHIPDNIFRVEHNTDHIDESSLRNHVALLYEYLKTDGKDPRTTYYLGLEYFNRGMYDKCIQVLSEYVKVGGSSEDRFNAYLKMAEAFVMMRGYKEARAMYNHAMNEMPNRPDSYLGIGETYFTEEDWTKAVEFMMTGLGKKMPKSMQAIDPMRYTFRPAGYIAQAYLQMGKPQDAYTWFLKCYQTNPNHSWVNQYKDLFIEAKELNDYVKAFVRLGQLTKAKYPKMLSKVAEIVPDELMDQEVLMDFKWRFSKPKIWGSKSVVIFCSSAFEDWGPESLEKGCGGSEEAVINLSRRWADMGYEVTVYNNCILEGKVDGVDWVRFERFNPRDIFNVLISWRNNIFLDPKMANKKLIDMHDVPDVEYYEEEVLDGATVMVKSKYHASLLPNDHYNIVPNGIDLSQFESQDKVKNNLVWTSSYDRGLEHLLNMWPEIRKEIPDATLDVAYGFNLFDQSALGQLPRGKAWKQKMLGLLDQEGITHHNRLSNEEVAKLYNKADIWAYPTDFPEISCLTAMKAQAAGCRVLTTGYAALEETVVQDEEDIQINTEEGYNTFKNKLIALLKEDRDEDKLAKTAQTIKEKYSWDTVAKAWAERF